MFSMTKNFTLKGITKYRPHIHHRSFMFILLFHNQTEEVLSTASSTIVGHREHR